MKELSILPLGYSEIIRVYGDPLAKDFVAEHLKSFELPFPLRASWNLSIKYHWMLMHRYVGDSMVDALREMMLFKELPYLIDNCYDVTGGCYNLRKKTGGDQLSTHSWGIAIDMCPDLGPFGRPSHMPEFIVKAFKRRGFVWGGDWKLKDAMHFQACGGY